MNIRPTDSLPSEFHIGYTRATLDGIVKTVSTVRLHTYDRRPFETMLFYGDSYEDHYCARYDTEEAARQGHQEVVSALLDGTLEVY